MPASRRQFLIARKAFKNVAVRVQVCRFRVLPAKPALSVTKDYSHSASRYAVATGSLPSKSSADMLMNYSSRAAFRYIIVYFIKTLC